MYPHTVSLPVREAKPRGRGLTMVIDPGLPDAYFADIVESYGDLIDFVKFGWATCLVTPHIAEKTRVLRRNGIEFYFGGTLFEKFLVSDRIGEWARLCHRAGARTVEISNGAIALSNDEKARHIRRFAGEFEIVSEVGFKDPERSERLPPNRWIEFIEQDLDAGARLVIAEARESGRSGICRPNGDLRIGLIEEIAESGIDTNRIMFEAPTKELQVHLLHRLGPQANLGNIHADSVIGLETLRLGLRADTLTDFTRLDRELPTHA
ncbi:phosphosulfolactate synthase [Nocardia terpenica]|uniref:Phosphosulfolactate synthase n=1 Tax=Nocardia terpenica TaxID=455432 RepID=A0A164I577_9NOCA|nr:phosphosulfolactate synthase [Nocardia terpenica]KZM69111.1 phosphosulfolactate synthase [Nocardia terpenica]NQE87772.1 phosphosulfolactate synthase [Nocardia terpenica]